MLDIPKNRKRLSTVRLCLVIGATLLLLLTSGLRTLPF